MSVPKSSASKFSPKLAICLPSICPTCLPDHGESANASARDSPSLQIRELSALSSGRPMRTQSWHSRSSAK
eukprot:1433114-Pleurochrysis_carterae.AAC.1